MTYDEMYRELTEDFMELRAWMSHRWKDIRRRSLKARTFPFVVRHTHITSSHNEWTYNVSVFKKLRAGERACSMTYTRLRTDDGDYYMMVHPVTDSVLHVCAYLPHFFKRYAKRMGLNLSGHELADHYFMHNDKGVRIAQPDTQYDLCLCMEEGIAMGKLLNDRMIIYKTFIRYDMSIGWQKEAFRLAKERINHDILMVDRVPVETEITERYIERDKTKKFIF